MTQAGLLRHAFLSTEREAGIRRTGQASGTAILVEGLLAVHLSCTSPPIRLRWDTVTTGFLRGVRTPG